MKHRIIGLLLAAVMLASTLSGCMFVAFKTPDYSDLLTPDLGDLFGSDEDSGGSISQSKPVTPRPAETKPVESVTEWTEPDESQDIGWIEPTSWEPEETEPTETQPLVSQEDALAQNGAFVSTIEDFDMKVLMNYRENEGYFIGMYEAKDGVASYDVEIVYPYDRTGVYVYVYYNTQSLIIEKLVVYVPKSGVDTDLAAYDSTCGAVCRAVDPSLTQEQVEQFYHGQDVDTQINGMRYVAGQSENAWMFYIG